MQPNTRSSFQKLNVDNSCQKTRKIRYFWSLAQFYCISLLCAKYFVQDCMIELLCENSQRFSAVNCCRKKISIVWQDLNSLYIPYKKVSKHWLERWTLTWLLEPELYASPNKSLKNLQLVKQHKMSSWDVFRIQTNICNGDLLFRKKISL